MTRKVVVYDTSSKACSTAEMVPYPQVSGASVTSAADPATGKVTYTVGPPVGTISGITFNETTKVLTIQRVGTTSLSVNLSTPV